MLPHKRPPLLRQLRLVLLLSEYNTIIEESQNQQQQIDTQMVEIENLWMSAQQAADTTPNFILTDTIWTIDPNGGGDYSSLVDADAALDDFFILPSASLTLQLADGTHNLSAPITLEHPNGDRQTDEK